MTIDFDFEQLLMDPTLMTQDSPPDSVQEAEGDSEKASTMHASKNTLSSLQAPPPLDDFFALPAPGIESNASMDTLALPSESMEESTDFFSQIKHNETIPQLTIDTDLWSAPVPSTDLHKDMTVSSPAKGEMGLELDALEKTPTMVAAAPNHPWAETPQTAWPHSLKTMDPEMNALSTPTSIAQANQGQDPLQLGPGWTTTAQLGALFSTDQSSRVVANICARIDRGFFMQENEWICYRRNYFQVSTTFALAFEASHEALDASMPLWVDHEGVRKEVQHFIIQVSSKLSNSTKRIQLVQHTAKRDKGPQQAPCRKVLLPGGDINSAATSNATLATYERLQFRSATANNGKRRAHQQYYQLYVDLIAQTTQQEEILVGQCQSAPLVVRGRSPGHYAANERRRMSSMSSMSSHHSQSHASPYDRPTAEPHALPMTSFEALEGPAMLPLTFEEQEGGARSSQPHPHGSSSSSSFSSYHGMYFPGDQEASWVTSPYYDAPLSAYPPYSAMPHTPLSMFNELSLQSAYPLSQHSTEPQALISSPLLTGSLEKEMEELLSPYPLAPVDSFSAL